jgi:catechol 2,3-dioxygenase-like lactoylglutathione lyase family enzyme
MAITGIIPQLRTTDLAASIRFYTEVLGCTLEFHYEDHYAGLRAGNSAFHLKQTCERDPSIDDVAEGGHFHLYFATPGIAAFAATLKSRGVALEKGVHETPWGTREFVLRDDQGHTLYFGEPADRP